MTRTAIYELAVTTAKGSIAENNPIELSEIVTKAAKHNKVDPSDFQTFQQYFNTSRQAYQGLERTPLPSESKRKPDPAATPGAITTPAGGSNATAKGSAKEKVGA